MTVRRDHHVADAPRDDEEETRHCVPASTPPSLRTREAGVAISEWDVKREGCDKVRTPPPFFYYSKGGIELSLSGQSLVKLTNILTVQALLL